MNIDKVKVFSGLFWSYGERITAQCVSFLVSIVLARLIMPEDYGIIALVTIFISLANTFVMDGFGSALIQKKEADQIDFCSIFYFSEILSILLYVLIYLLAPYVSIYFKIPKLSSVMRVMGLRIPLSAINSVQRAFVSRKMEFKKFFFSTFIGTSISAVTGVALAFMGAGVWALVAQYLLNSFVDTIVLFFTAGWRPEIKFSLSRLKPLVSYGSKILFVALMINVYTNLRNFIIGRKFSPKDLAYSNKGEQFPNLITVNINYSITSVIFPVLSQQQNNRENVLNMTRRAIKTGTFLLAPMLLGLAAVSEKVILLLLTEKWIMCVPYMRVMCVVYLLQPIQTSSLQAMKAVGEERVYAKLEIVKKIVGLAILFTSVYFFQSVIAILIGTLVGEIVVTIMNMPVNFKLFEYKIDLQLKDIFLPLTAACIMSISVYAIDRILCDLFWLPVEIMLGITIYVILAVVMKIDSLVYIQEIISEFTKRRRRNDTIS